MNKKENPGVSRRGAAMLLLFSLVVSVLLGFAMPVHAADDGRTTLRTLRVGFYAYTGYHIMDADGSRSGYAYETLQDMAKYENLNYEYLGYDCDVNEIWRTAKSILCRCCAKRRSVRNGSTFLPSRSATLPRC